ncbi:MAG TPA: AMP-binding protein, partial [Methylomirabilota bacterium]|nr:AMP-binding protein [Methylomirabilota bacterium]
VPLTHAGVCLSARTMCASCRLDADDRCLNVLPLHHSHGLMSALMSSLVAGASVVCTAGFEAGAFFDWVRELRPTWYTAVPTVHEAVLRAARSLDGSRRDVPRLRLVRSASSPMPPALAENLERLFDAPVIAAYGMTECASQIACNPLPPGVRKPGSVGVPTGCDVAVMGADGRLLARGTTGEIVVRGPSVTRGYDNDPEANRTAFVDGWLRTGDLGLVDADGYVFLTGRVKEIINRGGQSVIPREVDDALLEHPAVREAATFGVPHPTLGEDAAAAVVLREDAQVTERALRVFLSLRLADHKVPSQVLIVEALPGPPGKIRRLGLAAELAARLRPPVEAPRDELEA